MATTSSAAELRAIGEKQHGAKAAEAKRDFNVMNPYLATLWDEQQGDRSQFHTNPNVKIVHFIRHGQGYHNLLGEVTRDLGATFSETGDYEAAIREKCPYLHKGIHDPPLTPIGRDDAKKLHPLSTMINPDVFVVSPMKRATETIMLGFQPKMKQAPNIPIIAHEGCREQCGVFMCDKRSTKSEYIEMFPSIDYTHIISEEDSIWKEKNRENMLEMAYRAHDFLNWLFEGISSDYNEIVVGTHSAWLMAVFGVTMDIDKGSEHLKTMFATGECRSVIVTRTKS